MFCSMRRSSSNALSAFYVMMTSSPVHLSSQGSIVKDPSISVSRVSWSPDGNLIGTLFKVHHIYCCIFNWTQMFESDTYSLVQGLRLLNI